MTLLRFSCAYCSAHVDRTSRNVKTGALVYCSKKCAGAGNRSSRMGWSPLTARQAQQRDAGRIVISTGEDSERKRGEPVRVKVETIKAAAVGDWRGVKF